MTAAASLGPGNSGDPDTTTAADHASAATVAIVICANLLAIVATFGVLGVIGKAWNSFALSVQSQQFPVAGVILAVSMIAGAIVLSLFDLGTFDGVGWKSTTVAFLPLCCARAAAGCASAIVFCYLAHDVLPWELGSTATWFTHLGTTFAALTGGLFVEWAWKTLVDGHRPIAESRKDLKQSQVVVMIMIIASSTCAGLGVLLFERSSSSPPRSSSAGSITVLTGRTDVPVVARVEILRGVSVNNLSSKHEIDGWSTTSVDRPVGAAVVTIQAQNPTEEKISFDVDVLASGKMRMVSQIEGYQGRFSDSVLIAHPKSCDDSGVSQLETSDYTKDSRYSQVALAKFNIEPHGTVSVDIGVTGEFSWYSDLRTNSFVSLPTVSADYGSSCLVVQGGSGAIVRTPSDLTASVGIDARVGLEGHVESQPVLADPAKLVWESKLRDPNSTAQDKSERIGTGISSLSPSYTVTTDATKQATDRGLFLAGILSSAAVAFLVLGFDKWQEGRLRLSGDMS
ncbi:hypothetical protein [Nakamurella multipartita]|uniref:Uncharacterized protein n=1 Tax=Nakamurella multipartita (strain ATCC 700099 / DSM 44233 / CIP 104796 / JCM 9543 / NBRC 105858 / Y-104) TaxID=479431 RepID=C8X869_NAKMY|nr:hypothetical protein [Nakamurella multipartita]ACV77045.1 hypothetical protein Namu_0630 [Nakamurella multipartita DSM 44233]